MLSKIGDGCGWKLSYSNSTGGDASNIERELADAADASDPHDDMYTCCCCDGGGPACC